MQLYKLQIGYSYYTITAIPISYYIMLLNILFLFIILALLNNLNIPFINYALFQFNGHAITVYNLIVVALFVYLIGFLPRPFKEIVTVLLILWILSILGILAIGGFTNIVIVAIVLILLFNIFR